MTRGLLFFVAAPIALLAQAPPDCWKLKSRGRVADATTCFLKLSTAPDPALRAEGLWGLRNFDAAKAQFEAALKAKPKDAQVRIRYGRMFLERYNKSEAGQLFTEAQNLSRDNADATLGLALVASDGFDKMATTLARKALEQNPKLTEAQELLAVLAVEDGDFTRAREESDKALKLDPEALTAMAVHASVDLLEDKPSTPWFDRAYAINPKFGDGHSLAAHFLVINRRYEEGIAQYRKAVELDPQNFEAWSELGINLMRLARETEARRCLETAYNNGWKDAKTVNGLRLIDSYSNFATFKYDRFTLRIHKKEADLLKPYIEEQMFKILAAYDRKYGFTMKEHVQIEVYPNHDDFAVRTVGLPGLGALGVTFGHIVAMDSPSGRKAGSFHWASTLWHEMSHVYSITYTKHRIPRWYTEGLAVYEETATSPDWGDRVDLPTLKAIRDKKLLPVNQLERGFVRPEYPNQVLVSYFQAGRICNFIEAKWGHAKLIEMMKEFVHPGVTADAAMRKTLGLSAEEFDKQFFAWIDQQFKPLISGFEGWEKKVNELHAAFKSKDYEKVIREGPAVRDLYPDFVEIGSVYELLADTYAVKGDKKNQAAELLRYAKAGGRTPDRLIDLAKLQTELGQKKEAAESLNRINLIYPVQAADLHDRLGQLYLDLGNLNGAIRELRAVVYSKPLDQATARYQLARALAAANRIDEAQEEVVSALEVAPGYKPAQKLLLELSAKQSQGPATPAVPRKKEGQ